MSARLQALLLADEVRQDSATGKHVITGTFARLEVSAMPANLDREVSIYCALTGVVGTGRVSLVFETDDGRVLAQSSELTLACNDARLVVEFGLPIPSLPLPAPGWYKLVLVLNDKRFASLALELSLRL